MSHVDTEEGAAPPRLDFSLPYDPARLLRARTRLRDYLRCLTADEQSIDDVILAVMEAATNALRYSSGSGVIGISLRVEGDELCAVVRDDGPGFDPSRFDPEVMPDPLTIGGRGLYLMAQLSDDVQFDFSRGCEVRLRKRLALAADAALPALACAASPESLTEGLTERLVEMLEEVDEGFAALDWELRYLYVNSAAERELGRTREELLGRSVFEVFPAIAGTLYETQFRAALEQGGVAHFEAQYEPLAQWEEMRVYPAPFGLAVYFRDITGRKRVEAEHAALLRQVEAQRAQLGTILEHLHEGVLVVDGEGTLLEANAEARRLCGLPRERVRRGLGEWLESEIVAGDGRPLPRDEWPTARVARGEAFADLEITMRNAATRSEVTVTADGVPLAGEDGASSLALISLRDTTERKRRERQAALDAEVLRARARILEEALTAQDAQTLGWGCLRVVEAATGSAVGALAGSGGGDGWSGMVWIHDAAGAPSAGTPAPEEERVAAGRNGALRSLQRLVLERRQALLINAPAGYLRLDEGHEAPLAAFLGVPLVSGDEVRGVLAVADRPGGYADDHRRLLEQLAPVVLQVFEHHRPRATLQESLARTRVLAAIAAAAAGADRLEDVAEAVLVAAALHLGLKAGAVSALDETGTALRRVATFGRAYEEAWVRDPIPLDDTLNIGRMLLRGLPYLTSDSAEQTEASRRRFARMGLSEDSWVKVPIAAGDRTLGAFTLVFPGKRSFDGDDLTFYRAVADGLGVALQRASYAAERDTQAVVLRRTAELSFVLDAVNDMIRGVGEPRTAVPGAAALAAAAIGADGSAVYLPSDDGWHLLGGEGSGSVLPGLARDVGLGLGEGVALKPFAVCRCTETPPVCDGSLLVVPLVAAGALLGLAVFAAPADRVYQEAELDFVRKLGPALGGALQNTELFAALNAQLELSHLLLTSSRVLNGWGDLETMFAGLGDVLLSSAPGCRASVVLLDMDRREISLVVSRGVRPLSSGPFPLSRAPDAMVEAMEAQRTVVVDYEKRPDVRRHGAPDPNFVPRHLLAVPVVSRGRLVGALSLEASAERGAFSATEVNAVAAIASHAGTAIENARLRQAEVEAQRCARRELEISQLLLMTAGVFASQTDPQQLFEHIAEALSRSFPGARTSIAVGDEQDGFVVVAAAGEGRDRVGAHWAPADYSAPARRAMRTGRAVVVDYDALSGRDAAIGREHGMRVSIVAPMFTRGHTVGVLGVDRAGARAEFTDRELSLAQGIADEAAIAVYIAAMFEKEREEVRFHEALDAAQRLLHSSLDDDDIFAGALLSGGRALQAPSGVIAIHERGQWVVRYQFGFAADMVGSAWSAREAPFMAEAARRREPLVIGDLRSEPGRAMAGTATPPGVRAVLVAPLLTGDEVVGLLIYNKPEPESFPAAEVMFAGRLARSVSLALQNARLFAHEHTIAETLQEALLAMPNSVPGFSFAHAYHSAALAARVGGDFYDIFELADGLLGVVVGDISGKGLDAAVLTSAVKNSLRAQAFEAGKSPADVLRMVNEVLVRSSAPEIFATVFYGVLDRHAGRLVYCNAGHTPGLLVCTTGAVVPLPHTSPVVGAFADLEYACAETAIAAGDLLFLYTDGLVEARARGVLFGQDALLRLFEDPAVRDPTVAVERVTAAVLAFAEGRLSDDMALLAVAIRP